MILNLYIVSSGKKAILYFWEWARDIFFSRIQILKAFSCDSFWFSPFRERGEKQKFGRQMLRLTWGMLWGFALFWVSCVWLLSLFLDCIPAELMDISCIWGNWSWSCCFAPHHAASSRALQSWVIGSYEISSSWKSGGCSPSTVTAALHWKSAFVECERQYKS